MSELQSLDSFLQTQGKAANLGTIEPVDGKPDLIKVTPWVAGLGCLCNRAIEVPKTSVEFVRRTDDRHTCCGKVFDVVEVHWAKESLMPISELFSQMATVAPTEDSHRIGSGNFRPQPQPWRQGRGDPFDALCIAECNRNCDDHFVFDSAPHRRCVRACDRICRS